MSAAEKREETRNLCDCGHRTVQHVRGVYDACLAVLGSGEICDCRRRVRDFIPIDDNLRSLRLWSRTFHELHHKGYQQSECPYAPCGYIRDLEAERVAPQPAPPDWKSLGFRVVHAVKDDFCMLIPLDEEERKTYGTAVLSPRAFKALSARAAPQLTPNHEVKEQKP